MAYLVSDYGMHSQTMVLSLNNIMVRGKHPTITSIRIPIWVGQSKFFLNLLFIRKPKVMSINHNLELRSHFDYSYYCEDNIAVLYRRKLHQLCMPQFWSITTQNVPVFGRWCLDKECRPSSDCSSGSIHCLPFCHLCLNSRVFHYSI